MADTLISTLQKLEAVDGTEIETKRIQYEVNVNHAWDHKLEQAQEVKDLWFRTADRQLATEHGKKYGFTSCYHAGKICALAAMPKTTQLEMSVFRIGNLAFIGSTNELFSDVGIYVRAYAPFETVVVCCGNVFYVPSAAAYDYRSYEADTSTYAKGTCERISREYVRMLEELK